MGQNNSEEGEQRRAWWWPAVHVRVCVEVKKTACRSKATEEEKPGSGKEEVKPNLYLTQFAQINRLNDSFSLN